MNVWVVEKIPDEEWAVTVVGVCRSIESAKALAPEGFDWGSPDECGDYAPPQRPWCDTYRITGFDLAP